MEYEEEMSWHLAQRKRRRRKKEEKEEKKERGMGWERSWKRESMHREEGEQGKRGRERELMECGRDRDGLREGDGGRNCMEHGTHDGGEW